MSKAIICLVFIITLSSIGYGRVIEKRSPRSPFGPIGFRGQVEKAGDFDSDAIQMALQSAMEEKLKGKFANSDTLRNVRNTKVKDAFSKDASDFGGQIDNDIIRSALQSAMEEKLKSIFANSDTVRNVRSTKIKDAFSKDAFSKDAFVDALKVICPN